MAKKIPSQELDSDLYEVVESIAGIGDVKIQGAFIQIARKIAEESGVKLVSLFDRYLELGTGLKPETWDGLIVLADFYETSKSQIINLMVEGELEYLKKEPDRKVQE